MSTDLASLTVSLEANIAQFTTGLNQATKNLQSFSDGAKSVLTDLAATLGVGLSADAIVDFSENILESAAALEKLSLETGDSVEALGELQAAAKITGVDDLSTALARLSKSQADAEQGNEKAISVFKALGISLQDLAGLKPDQLFLKIADSMSGYADGATKTAAAQELMGRGAQALVPLLDQGAAGFAALQAQVDALGGGTSKEFAEAAEQFEQDLAKLQIAATGVTRSFLSGILPALDQSIQGFTTFIAETGTASDNLDVVSIGIKTLASAILTVLLALEDVGSGISHELQDAGEKLGIYAAAAAQVAQGHFSQVSAIWKAGNADIQAQDDAFEANSENRTKAYTDALGKIWTSAADAKLAAAKTAQDANFDPIEALATMKPQLVLPDTTALKAINDQIDALNKKGQDLDLTTGMQKTNIATVETSISVGKLHDELQKSGDEAGTLTTQLLAAAAAADRSEAIASITKETVAISQQIDTYQESKDAVDAYTLSHGKLGEQLDALGTKGDALRAKVIDLDKQFETKVDATAIAGIDAQILQLTGHLTEAATAQFDLQHQALQANLTATNDASGQQALDNLKAATLAQAAYNQEQLKSADINSQLEAQLADIALQQQRGAITDLQAQQQETAARAAAVTQLTAVDAQLTSIAQNSGQTALIDGAQKAQVALTNLKTQAVDPLTKTINDDLVQDSTDAFTDLVTGAKSASDAIGEFLDDISKQLVQLAAKNFFQGLFAPSGSAGGIGTFLAGLFGGGKAGGGPVVAGSAYRVNEGTANSEWFVPNMNGTIVPADQMGGGGGLTQQFILQAPQGSVSRQTQLQLGAQAAKGLNQANRRNN